MKAAQVAVALFIAVASLGCASSISRAQVYPHHACATRAEAKNMGPDASFMRGYESVIVWARNEDGQIEVSYPDSNLAGNRYWVREEELRIVPCPGQLSGEAAFDMSVSSNTSFSSPRH